MYTFRKIKSPENPHEVANVQIKIENNEVTWIELTEEFKNFLRACGFKFSDAEFQQEFDSE